MVVVGACVVGRSMHCIAVISAVDHNRARPSHANDSHPFDFTKTIFATATEVVEV